jgi:hypothetical protein
MPTTPDARFTRVLSRGDRGTDVEAVSRAFIRAKLWPGMTLAEFAKMPVAERQHYDAARAAAQRRLEKQIGTDPDGVYARFGHEELERREAFDAKARLALRRWRPGLPPLIEPKQGFSSLHPSLRRVYTMGIALGFTDLGTYNPRSILGSGNLSDHATSVDCATSPSRPAKAIDFGIDPDTGWQNLEARAFVLAIYELPVLEYVILGDKICFREGGIKPYTAGGHLNHIHASGNRRTTC